jgi:hypothetical protein
MSGSKEGKRRATANCFYSGELASARMLMDQQLPNRSASVGGRGETYGAPDECLSMSRALIFDSNVWWGIPSFATACRPPEIHP